MLQVLLFIVLCQRIQEWAVLKVLEKEESIFSKTLVSCELKGRKNIKLVNSAAICALLMLRQHSLLEEKGDNH